MSAAGNWIARFLRVIDHYLAGQSVETQRRRSSINLTQIEPVSQQYCDRQSYNGRSQDYRGSRAHRSPPQISDIIVSDEVVDVSEAVTFSKALPHRFSAICLDLDPEFFDFCPLGHGLPPGAQPGVIREHSEKAGNERARKDSADNVRSVHPAILHRAAGDVNATVL